jgi:predicted NBD/HSP70 family sugar kinase
VAVTIVKKKSQRDKHLIEALVYQQGPISRVSIHALTNLRRSTISLLTRQLLTEGKLIEAGPSDNPLGRKQILLDLNRKFGFLVGVEFDDERVTAGVMDLQPSVTRVITESTDLSHGKEGLLRQLQSAVRRVVAASRLPWTKLLGIGIADPGLVDTRRGVTTSSSTIDFWNDVPLTATFEKEFKVPVLVESKTRAKAVAEQRLGVGQREPNMIYLDYGTGIGAGVIVDGKLLYGHNCGVGEVGHTNMVRSGPTCKCGSNGCLEAVAGASAVENRTRKALSEGVSSRLLAMAQEDPSRITVWLVLEAARAGDKMCWNIVAEIAEEIGVAMANLVNLFNPSMIVFDQRLSVTGEEFLNLISRVVKSNALAGSASGLSLRFATLGREAGLLGVGLQILERQFSTARSGRQ